MQYAFLLHFRDEASAYRYVEAIAWPNGPVCAHCGGQRVGRLRGCSTQFGTYKCYRCRKLFTVKTGTIFAFSHIALHKWLQAIYLCECGTAALRPQELSTILNVTFKTAALIIERLRRAALEGGLIRAAVSSQPVRDGSDQLARTIVEQASNAGAQGLSSDYSGGLTKFAATRSLPR
jgi:transposase-like protein